MDADESSERLEQLFRQTFRRVMAYCLRRTGDTAAHDAVAEVYAVAWRRRRHLPDDGEEAVLWLLGIARRVLANQARSQRRWSRLLLRVAEQPDPPRRQERDADDELLAALEQGSAADRELLRLAYWDDLSRHEIAAVLGISVGAVDTRLHRARQRLKERLAASSSDLHATKEKDHAER
ncbi:sigma-70 family RNA polymerase sigma factor [Streptomyces sp. DG2A-72]|uniref:RNA polymerase sigma factor n=1 Tax=Streptomyces sp. DG2A-72 TaxID=3051386 RepID=UPI00265C19B5|nr:sigma-70 family RNA polymerase sigma factor [Streptomyces sp. DG2A-72]MDO0938996.1 sigma-70 family RNA polymerase sigma factor [Streptomyces sp. DG2A-72]